jgi:hypothetical protein
MALPNAMALSKATALPKAMALPKETPLTRNASIGGPRVQSSGRLGGTSVGRTNQSAAISGTQFHRKF